jgi:hypothetical protein
MKRRVVGPTGGVRRLDMTRVLVVVSLLGKRVVDALEVQLARPEGRLAEIERREKL